MHVTQTYDVLVDCLCGGKIHREGDTVELTDKQAKYLLLNKKIAPVKLNTGTGAKKSTKQKKGVKNA